MRKKFKGSATPKGFRQVVALAVALLAISADPENATVTVVLIGAAMVTLVWVLNKRN